ALREICCARENGASPPGCRHPGGPPDRRGGGWGRTRRSQLFVPEANPPAGYAVFILLIPSRDPSRLLRPLVRLVAAGDEWVQTAQASESAVDFRLRSNLEHGIEDQVGKDEI